MVPGRAQEYEGVNYTVNYTKYAWGIGAWGANCVKDWQMINERDRAAFIEGANEVFGSPKFPRLRAGIYFDSCTPALNALSDRTAVFPP